MKKTAVRVVLAMLSLGLVAGVSFAGSMGKMKFSDINTNGDETISLEEYQKAFPSSEKKGFVFLDKNKDSQLDRKEWKTFEDMHKGMGSSYHGKKEYQEKEKYHGKKKPHDKEMPDPAGFNAHFGDIDTNDDGGVTLKEFNAFFPGKSKTEAVFNAVDLDKNKSLDHDEWHEFKEAHGMRDKD